MSLLEPPQVAVSMESTGQLQLWKGKSSDRCKWGGVSKAVLRSTQMAIVVLIAPKSLFSA